MSALLPDPSLTRVYRLEATLCEAVELGQMVTPPSDGHIVQRHDQLEEQ